MPDERTTPSVQRGSGVALWRQIADTLRQEIVSGVMPEGTQLPSELALADRFSVNRHTVRAAVANLAMEGLVRAVQGRGTFVGKVPTATSDPPAPPRVSAGFGADGEAARGEVVEAGVEPAPDAVCMALRLSHDALVTRMETVSEAASQPIIWTTSWFSATRFPAIDAAYRELSSVRLALRGYDIDTCVRVSTRIIARTANAEECDRLELSPGAIVMVAEGIDVDAEGWPVHFGVSHFAAERVELVSAGLKAGESA